MGVDLRPYRLLDSHRSISLSLYNFGTTLRTTCVHEHIWRSQGHAVPTSDHTAVSRSHRGDSGSRRSASPFRPHRRVAVVQRRSQLQPTVPPVVQHVCVAVNYCRCLRSLGHWSGVGEDSRAHRRLRNWSVLSSFRLFARHSWLDGGKDERLSVAEPRIGGGRADRVPGMDPRESSPTYHIHLAARRQTGTLCAAGVVDRRPSSVCPPAEVAVRRLPLHRFLRPRLGTSRHGS